jgi:EAL domain-containing protein (putative c-di-GMP-specific phosphodiesterase class I)
MQAQQIGNRPARTRHGGHTTTLSGRQKSRMAKGNQEDGLGVRVCQGLRAGEFHLAFQGVYHVGTGQLSRVETQVRWAHPEYGLLLPGVFMEQIDSPDALYELACFTARNACRELSLCVRRGLQPCPVAIEVAPCVVMDERFAQHLDAIAQSEGVAPNLLEIELAESEDAAQLLSIRALTRDLRDLGVAISYGNFGSGGPSLARLAALEVDTVKLSPVVLSAVPQDKRACAVVAGVFALLDTLDVRVVVSGIETAEQAQWVGRWENVFAVGLYLAKPVKGLVELLG